MTQDRRHHPGPTTPAETLSAIPLALGVLAQDLGRLAGDCRELLAQCLEDPRSMSQSLLREVTDRLTVQARSASAIAERMGPALSTLTKRDSRWS